MQSQASRSKKTQLQNEANFQWSAFTPEDLHAFDGERNNLVGLLEARYGFARPRAEREADLFLSQFEDKLKRAV
jgi:hypothetical protein